MKKLSDYIYYEEPAGVIYCGDCLEILPLLEPGSVDLVLTDPEYGIAEVKDYRGWRYAHHYSLVPKSVEAEFKKAINYEVIS